MKKLIALAVLLPFLAACASSPDQIAPAHMSTNAYMDRSCTQLAREHNAMAPRLASLEQAQKARADSDAAMTAVSLILFWPAMFAVKGDTGHEVGIAEAKGRLMAIRQAAASKGCPTA